MRRISTVSRTGSSRKGPRPVATDQAMSSGRQAGSGRQPSAAFLTAREADGHRVEAAGRSRGKGAAPGSWYASTENKFNFNWLRASMSAWASAMSARASPEQRTAPDDRPVNHRDLRCDASSGSIGGVWVRGPRRAVKVRVQRPQTRFSTSTVVLSPKVQSATLMTAR